MELEWFKAYVESLLRTEWDGHAPTDDDGDWPFRHGAAACWVGVRPQPYLRAQVLAYAAHGLKPSARLLRELNEANWCLVDSRVYWRSGFVVVETSIPAEGVDQQSLQQACESVGGTADELSVFLAAMFDGQTLYPASLEA